MARGISFGGGLAEIPEPRYVRQRAMADALLQQSQGPISGWGEGVANLARTAAAGFINRRANEAEQTETKARADLLRNAVASGDFLGTLSQSDDPWAQAISANYAMAKALEGPGETWTTLTDEQEAVMGLPTAGVYQQNNAGQVKAAYDAPTEDMPSAVREYQFAVSQGYPGTFQDFQLEQQRAGAANTTIYNKDFGPIPEGYRLVETPQGVSMEKVPGSPADQAAQNRAAAQEATADIVTTDINRTLEAMDKAILPTTGVVGGYLKDVPGTAARDVAGLVQTIRGNIGIDKLQQMRMQSPTGGALGNVTEQELATLQSVIGNLEQSQSDEQFRYNLKRVYNAYLDIVHGKNGGPARYPLEKPKGPETAQPAPPANNPYSNMSDEELLRTLGITPQ